MVLSVFFSFFFFFSVPEWAERAALAAIDENQLPVSDGRLLFHTLPFFVSAEIEFVVVVFCWWCLPLLKWRDGRI